MFPGFQDKNQRYRLKLWDGSYRANTRWWSLGKGVSMLWNFMPCHMRWMLEVSICSEWSWRDLWSKHQVGVLNTQESHLVASELPFSGDCSTAYGRKDPCLLLYCSFDHLHVAVFLNIVYWSVWITELT